MTNYYPGGMTMPGRNLSAYNYRFGNQKQEGDDEIYGDGTIYAFTERMEDTRTNRFWSRDPLFKTYPYNSPYAFSENRLTDGFELEGKEYVRGSKYAYDGTALDYLKAVPNALTDIGNALFDATWNGAVDNVKSIQRGTWTEDITGEIKGIPKGISNYVSNSWTYASTTSISQQLKDAVSPEAIEGMLAFAGTVALTKSLPSIKANIGLKINSGPKLGIGTKGRSTTLYRAVSKAELDDIAINGIRNSPGYETGKLFATSAQDAANFGRLNFGLDKQPFTIIKTSIPNKYSPMLYSGEMDLMQGVSVPNNLFNQLSKPSIFNKTPLPNHPWIK